MQKIIVSGSSYIEAEVQEYLDNGATVDSVTAVARQSPHTKGEVVVIVVLDMPAKGN